MKKTGKSGHSKNIKIIVLGNTHAGKTSIILRYTDDTYTDTFTTTLGIFLSFLSLIGIDFKMRQIDVDGASVNVQIWDTGGQERYRTITRNYYEKAAGIILVYDSTDEKSFEEISNWVTQIEGHAQPDVVKLLVAAKCDRPDAKISASEGQLLAEEYGLKFFETSAKSAGSVEEVFAALIRSMIQK